MIIAVVVAVLALVGGGVTAAVLVTKNDKPATDREAGPPDGDVLEERTSTEAVKYGDLTVIDACTLMPAAVLEETGFGDVARGGHIQTYVQKSVPAAEATVKDANDGISSCRYDIQKPDRIDFLALTVHQAPFNSLLPAGVISDDVEISLGGLRAFTKKSASRKPDDFFTRIYSADGKTAVYLNASRLADNKELDYKAAHAQLLERVALNLARATGAQTRYAYTGRYQNVPSACDILTGELFEQLAQSKDSGVVETEIGESESRQESTPNGTNVTQSFYFTTQTCQRNSPERLKGKRGLGLKMELSVHRDADMARNYEPDCDPNSSSRKMLGDAKNATEKVGDGDACAFPIGNSLVFSYLVGRTQVRLTPYGSWAPENVDEFIAKFTPIAQKTADEVRKAIG
ncbi:hypothetical protein [Lentzea kentuckyensis]|uniref:hypothetical protein n=1 Tax=Lentzea kentuckyensis TaxID=360086 RepID=UPI000A3C27D4|nr:hypothetical protein [Lentzea kentuckyensis]